MLYRSLFLSILFISACTNSTKMSENTLFDFTSSTPQDAWAVEDDTVMGGRSEGHLEITDAGHARFHGHVSLENDGGFSSIQHQMQPAGDVSGKEAFLVRLKGDGKKYTLRVKSKPDQKYFHEATFPTSGDWETVRVPFNTMSAVHHGEPVNVPNFDGGPVNALQVLIGNKKEQDFELLIDHIAAE